MRVEGRTDGQTDRQTHDEVNRLFSRFMGSLLINEQLAVI